MHHLSNNTLFVVSAYKNNNPMADAVYTNELKDVLEDSNKDFIQSTGKWNGQEEEVFIVSSPAGVGFDIVKDTILDLATVFEQTSILEIDSNNSLLYLHGTDGSTECLGNFRLSSDVPIGDYTKINDMYISLTN